MTSADEHQPAGDRPEPPAPAEGRRTQETAGSSPVRAGSRVVIIGGGPGGYEAALVAAQLGARVSVVERQGMGGAAVLTDVVPSKTLIATAEWMTATDQSAELGIRGGAEGASVDMAAVNRRVLTLAARQSQDIRARLEREGVRVVDGVGRLVGDLRADGTRIVRARTEDGEEDLVAEIVLVATGAHPRVLPDALPDGERILTWAQMYNLTELPEHLVVVGSGVTGAEFAGAYNGLGVPVTLVSSRDRVLPGEDEDAAELIETVFRRRGMNVLSRSRAAAVRRVGGGVEVELTDGRVIAASHCLLAVGGVPNTEGLGLEDVGVALTEQGHVRVDRVSRTTAVRVYAAGDCTGVLPLASVAAMQGRIAMWHALGDAVAPLDLDAVTANIFTAPEIATIGVTEKDVQEGKVDAVVTQLPLARNPRAKMLGIREGFVKVMADRHSGAVIGGVVVAPRASELIFPLAIAVTQRITVDQLANVFTIYPSLTGSIAEAARTLHQTGN
ncbi:NAD(P)H-quinone dehydrogenase [Georgenia wutianyii]|uniref:NAD(P)H-quinone dehydrogenase n=1 Tax=Georgenia wutianyii TaxID=2585135 RepID=A0ABX5VNK2_9MICO|nr:NAD(P)H-quinone dehydrogenase [Georgenia wutianyii]QDB78629.1 NAD(P)H-quinone dehydrogenase [Georgenia wutianyii]